MRRQCGICGAPIERTKRFRWNSPHLESIHPIWWNWFKRWRVALLSMPLVGAPALVIADLATFRSGNTLFLVLANLSWIIAVQIVIVAYALKLRQVKLAWKKEHKTDENQPLSSVASFVVFATLHRATKDIFHVHSFFTQEPPRKPLNRLDVIEDPACSTEKLSPSKAEFGQPRLSRSERAKC